MNWKDIGILLAAIVVSGLFIFAMLWFFGGAGVGPGTSTTTTTTSVLTTIPTTIPTTISTTTSIKPLTCGNYSNSQMQCLRHPGCYWSMGKCKEKPATTTTIRPTTTSTIRPTTTTTVRPTTTTTVGPCNCTVYSNSQMQCLKHIYCYWYLGCKCKK